MLTLTFFISIVFYFLFVLHVMKSEDFDSEDNQDLV
jgi:hypothetical protein